MTLSAPVASCNKSTVTPAVLTGTWELRNVSGRFAGINKSYPAGNGNLRNLDADSIFIKSTPAKIDTIGKFHISAKSIHWAGKIYDGIYFNSSQAGNFWVLKSDTLTIGDPFS